MAVNLHTNHYRFGLDSGTESSHGWHANEDANPGAGAIAVDVPFLLRFNIQEMGGTAAANVDNQFQCRKNTGAWQNVTTTSSVCKAVAVVPLTEAGACTKRLSGTGTFETSGAGQTEDGLSGGNANDIAASGCSETECGLQLVGADLADGDVVEFRITSPDFAVTNDVVPALTVALPVTGSGTPAAQPAAVSGAGESLAIGSGGAAAQDAAVGGAGVSGAGGAGAPAAEPAQVAGAGAAGSGEVTGAGTSASGPAAIAGAGESASPGTGAPAAAAATVVGAGTSGTAGSGAPAASPAAAAGQGVSGSGGAGAPAAAAATVTGAGAVGDVVTGSGSPAAQPAVVDGVAASLSTGAGAVAAQASVVAGMGSSDLVGGGAAAAQPAASSGAGVSASLGEGAASAEAAGVEGGQSAPWSPDPDRVADLFREGRILRFESESRRVILTSEEWTVP